ncbi:MAG: hypothetical protein V1799_13435 [bacterium]
MLQRLCNAYGIDYDQWRSLTRTAFRLANRMNAVGGMGSRGKNMNHAIIFSLLMYFVLGLMQVAVVIQIPDLFWSSFIVFSIVAVMIASLIFIEFGSIIVAPEDYTILSYQPISSKTYFASKASFAILYILLYTAAMGLPAVVTFSLHAARFGSLIADPVMGLAAMAGLLTVAVSAAMSIILMYTLVLRHVHYRKLKNALSYLQLVMSFAIYGSYSLLPSLIQRIGEILPHQKPWWIFLVPISWYSSLLSLAEGNFHGSYLAVGIVGLVVFFGFIPLAASRISLTYAENLSEALTVPEEKQRSVKRESSQQYNIFFKRFEDRAIASLLINQFKHDTRFRLAILAVIPITILYIFMGLRGSNTMFNPFHPDWKSLGNSALLYMVIVLFPMMLKEAVTRSESYLASWIFFATPSDKVRLVLSIKRLLFGLFIVPYILFLSIVFSFFFDTMLQVLMHSIVLLLFSQIFLQLFFMLKPQIPFSVPRQLGERTSILVSLMIIVPVFLLVGLMIIAFFAYENLPAYSGTVLFLSLIVMLMEIFLQRRVAKRLGSLEFLG